MQSRDLIRKCIVTVPFASSQPSDNIIEVRTCIVLVLGAQISSVMVAM